MPFACRKLYFGQNQLAANHIGGSNEETPGDDLRGSDIWNDVVLDAMPFDDGLHLMARSLGTRLKY
jgi:hypothetical protein